MKKLIVLIVIVVIGWFVYKRFFAPSEVRVCDRLETLCADQTRTDFDSCEREMEQTAKLLDDKAVADIADCTASADTCMEAMGCVVGGATKGLTGDFLEGFKRAVND